MPLQRRGGPGKRNMASFVNCFVGKGWYSYLTKREQNVIHAKDVIVSNCCIPDDILNGVSRSDITNYEQVQTKDIKNSCMFRDGNSNNTKFQQELQRYEFIRSKGKKDSNVSSDIQMASLTISRKLLEQNQKVLSEVPSIDFLHQQMRMYMDTLPVSSQY